MSDLIQLQTGNPPWSPSADSSLVSVLNEYDGPLLAIVEQAGTEYMARCVVGELGSIQAWVYVRVDVLEAVQLREGTPEQIDEVADYLTQGPLSVAMCADQRIVYATNVEVPGGTVIERLGSIMQQVANSLQRVSDDASSITQHLVSIEI